MSTPAYRMDALIERGAAATRRAFPGKQMKYGRAAGVQRSTASRHLNGDPHSPASQYLRAALLIGFPLIAESMIAIQQQLQKMSRTELRSRLDVLNDLEHDADCDEDRQTLRAATNPTPEQFERAASADVRVAEISLERAAILRELAVRGDR